MINEMDSIFKETITNSVNTHGLSVLETDRSIKSMIYSTRLTMNGKKTTAVYYDADDHVLFEITGNNDLHYPLIGNVTKVDTRKQYLSNYEKNEIRLVKLKLHKKHDADIILWLENQELPMQAVLKSLIREHIKKL